MPRSNCLISPMAWALVSLLFASIAHADAPLATVSGALPTASWQPFPAGILPAIRVEDGKTLLTITATDSATPFGLRQVVALRPEWSKVLVRGWVRLPSVLRSPIAGTTVHVSVGLAWHMKATSQEVAIDVPGVPEAVERDGAGNWVEVNQLLDVPSGADQLIVTPQIVGATGSLDLRDMSVTGWVTTFDDEFQGTTLDTTRWTPTDTDHILFAPGQGYFSPDHVSVTNGFLRLHADKSPHGWYQWQSGEIRTVDKFQQLYGYWELRTRFPVTEGTWPAFYLLKYDDSWPPEIDICECTGRDMSTVYETNHYADDYGVHQASNVNFPQGDMNRAEWHTYAICWEPGALAWYIDGVYKGTTREPIARVADVPMYIRLNLGVGGWGGDPAKTPWPVDMDCKFVRVYQRSDMPLPLYPEHSIEITLPTNTATLSAIGCNPMTEVAVKWTLVEGPSGSAIDDPTSLVTKAKFSKPGMYRFRVSVTKGSCSASRDLLVFVNPS